MFRAALLSGVVLVAALPAYAVKYSVTLLQPSGFIYSDALGNTASNQVGYGLPSSSGASNHALLWSGSAASAIDLTPVGYTESLANAISGTQQAGEATIAGGAHPHAALWNSTPASAIDLNPVGFDSSSATGISGSTEVGYGSGPTFSNHTHALLWSGSAASAVDLNPAGFTDSRAAGASATNQVGQATNASNKTHAMLWSGTAASAVDLEPFNFDNTYAVAVSGSNQAGYGSPIGITNVHALLWHGTAASVVDLHPSGWSSSYINAVSGNTEVGTGSVTGTSFVNHALLWTGTAASVVDLHQFVFNSLGSNFVSSEANGIADNGMIVGRVQDASFTSYAVLWKPETGVLGDYNNNGVVDAADYVLWRSGATTLFNEVATPGANTIQDYTEWRARFGKTSASGSSALFSDHNVPEPSLIALILLAATTASARRSRHSLPRAA